MMNIRKRILLVTLGSRTGACGELFDSLSSFMEERHNCRSVCIDALVGSVPSRIVRLVWKNISSIRYVIRSDVILLHVFTFPALALILVAKLFKVKIVVFQWDVYPVSLNGRLYRSSFIHRSLQNLEEWCLRAANEIVVPSADFLSFVRRRDPILIPVWPKQGLALSSVRSNGIADGEVHVAFAGQINPLRGLGECLAHLRAHSKSRIVLHVFSSNPFPAALRDISATIRVQEHGMLSRADLQEELRGMHFGLISLSPLMDQPGFPHKIFDYLASGIPVLYFGRPLPAYVGLIEACGVGVDITNGADIDLEGLYDGLIQDLAAARARFLENTQLKWSNIEKIC